MEAAPRPGNDKLPPARVARLALLALLVPAGCHGAGVALWSGLAFAIFAEPPPPGPPPLAYVTDGCSAAPDFDFTACCEIHDQAYWPGGPASARLAADQALQACIRAAGHPVLAPIYYVGVRLGGGPRWPAPWRWGFGRPWPTDYAGE